MPILIVTTEKSGLDKYSQEIARRLKVRKIESRRYLSLLESYRLSRMIQRLDDIVHLPNQNFARYAIFLKSPFIITVHDLVRSCFGFDRETLAERVLLKLDKMGIKRASHVIAVSHCTKNDLVSYLKIPQQKISVIYNGVDHDVFKPYDVKPLDNPYILYVGSERPRKNLGRLFYAFAKLKRDFPELKLVKVGEPGRSGKYRTQVLRQLDNLGITREVIFVGHLTGAELARYYSGAALLAYPSLYEGFGLPPLEAMACGCPVVTSNTSALPEVVGDAGIMVDPYDSNSLAQAMARVLTDKNLREEMVRKGFEQARKFSWEETARQTQEVYNKVLAGG
ncbi:MAG TPA: glycosyltransferase family 4 protein [Dehalococcoidia bacterium]|nr:glycosyltransferase family 4 protein [Dehalococcoidia bacterium]